MTGLTFVHPWFLLLLVAVPLVFVLPRRADHVLHAIVRSIVLVLVVVALARPVTTQPDDAARHVVVVDLSASATDAARGRAVALVERIAGELPDSARAALVTCGADVMFTGNRTWDAVESVGESSELGRALAAAGRHLPDGAHGAVTIISDGLAVAPDWGPAALALQQRGIPVHVCRLDARVGDVRPVELVVVDEPRVGATVRIEVAVEGPAADVTVTARADGRVLASAPAVLVGATRSIATLSFEPDAAGFLALDVDVEAAEDADPGNNRRSTVLAVRPPQRAIYLGQRVAGGADALQQLVGRAVAIDDADALGTVTPEALDDYDLAIVDDRPAETLSESLQSALVDSVRDRGLGVVVAGGNGAFGPGGWHDTPIAAMLPVEFVQKEEKRDPSTTLVVIIDTSGSMSGNRVQLAKEVSRLAIRRLLPHDKVGIVEFYGAKRWAAPIQPASNLIELERALNRLDAGGGTVILPAIEEAFYGMQNVQTRYKHVLVLTDGGVETGAFEPLLRRMAEKGINVSTVLVGGDAHSEFLVTLANWGKGRYYSVPNRFNLPEILLKQPATAKLPAYLPGTHAVRSRGGRGWWGDVDRAAIPPLAGYVQTRSRPGAAVLLETAETGHPVVSTWQWGLGRVTAMMTEPTGPGTEGWRDWPGYGAWLGRLLERTASEDRDPFTFVAERRDGEVVVEARRRRRGEHAPVAAVLAADGAVLLELRPRSRDLFTASVAAPASDEVRFTVGAVDPGSGRRTARPLVAPAIDRLARETQVDPRTALELETLAAMTGGVILDASLPVPALAAGGDGGAITLRKLWPIALLLALVFYLGDIVLRRWPR